MLDYRGAANEVYQPGADLGVLVPWASNPDGVPRPNCNGYRRYPRKFVQDEVRAEIKSNNAQTNNQVVELLLSVAVAFVGLIICATIIITALVCWKRYDAMQKKYGGVQSDHPYRTSGQYCPTATTNQKEANSLRQDLL